MVGIYAGRFYLTRSDVRPGKEAWFLLSITLIQVIITVKKHHARRKRNSSCFVLVASRTSSAVLKRGGCWGNIIGMYFEAVECSLVELGKGTTKRPELSLVPRSDILLPNLIATSFSANMTVPTESQTEATERKILTNIGNKYAN